MISRSDAIAQGLLHYFTGKPCGKGHIAARLVSGRQCVECSKINRQATFERNREREQVNNRAWLKAHPEYKKTDNTHAERYSRWAAKNPEVIRRHSRNSKKKRRLRTPAWFGELDNFVMDEAYNLCERRLQETGIKWEVDHLIPLCAIIATGLHCADNLQVIPKDMNRAKGNRLVWTERYSWLT